MDLTEFRLRPHVRTRAAPTTNHCPTNIMGAARVLHLDRNGKFIRQWFGHEAGQGKFDQIHGLAVDPNTGDVWIGDREQYRIQVYSGDGKFLRTILTRNLSSTLRFDRDGFPWMATGQDGQVLKLDRSGKVIGAIGNGMGIGHGQFIEFWPISTSTRTATSMSATPASDVSPNW